MTDDFDLDIQMKDKKKKEKMNEESDFEKNQRKTWIGVPVYDEDNKKTGEETKELGDCSPEEFFNWMIEIDPRVKNLDHAAEDYKDRDKKEKAFHYIIGLARSIGRMPNGY